MLLAAVAYATLARPASAREELTIEGTRGIIEFAIGDSRLFRTTASFKTSNGHVHVDDADVPRSSVEVVVQTGSIEMLDRQQVEMLKDADFFDVTRFPQMTFRSDKVVRTGDATLTVEGLITLRGITRPMTLDVTVSDRRPDAPPGTRYARFRGSGKIKRSEFGMTRFVDMVGDTVEISIRADALRR
ncbi:MAG: YceI family protein [Reyranella sp.]|nr:YceI family protein [Reyranella sp.]